MAIPFSNKAQLVYKGTVTSSNTVTGEIIDTVSVTKSTLGSSYSEGGKMTFIISIVNAGNTAYNDITVTDDLGGYQFAGQNVVPLTFESGSARLFSNGQLTAPTPLIPQSVSPLVFSGITIPANGNVLIVYEARANSFAPLGAGQSITNTAALTGSGLVGDISGTSNTVFSEEPILSIVKSLEPTQVADNGTVIYEFTIENRGASAVAATDDTVVEDTFAPILENISVSFNNTPWTAAANYSYNSTTGAFATTAGAITVPAAQYTQNADGSWNVEPGRSVLTISGTI